MLPVSQYTPEPPPIYVPPLPGFSFWQGLWIFAQLQLVPVVVFIPAIIAGMVLHRKFEEHPFVILVGSLLAAGWVIRSYCTDTATPLPTLAGPFTCRPLLLITLGAGVIGMLLLEIILSLWLMARFPFLEPDLNFGISQSPFGAFLLIVIAAPLTEELIFRAILLRGFVPRYGLTRAAAAAAALFALSHLYPIRFPGMFAVGFLLGWVYQRTGTIWPGVLAHLFNNAIAFYMLLQEPNPRPTPAQSWQEIAPWALPGLLAGTLLLAAAILAGRRILANKAAVPALAVP